MYVVAGMCVYVVDLFCMVLRICFVSDVGLCCMMLPSCFVSAVDLICMMLLIDFVVYAADVFVCCC